MEQTRIYCLFQFEARRNLCSDPGHQMRHVRRDGLVQVCGDATRLAATAFIEDRDASLEAGAVLGESRARHRACEDEVGRLGQTAEGLGPGGRIRCETGPCDGDEPSAGGQTREGRAQMPGRRLGRPTIDIGLGREGRVHQDDARA